MLCTGMNVDSSLTFDHTPLMCAVSLADHDVAKVLLDRGANANFKRGTPREQLLLDHVESLHFH